MNQGYKNDQPSYNEAIKTAQKEQKPLLLIFSASWCSPCKKLKHETIYPLIEKLRACSVVYIVDVDDKDEQKVIQSYKKLPGQWRFGGYVPTLYMTDEKAEKLVKKKSGYMTTEEFVEWFNN